MCVINRGGFSQKSTFYGTKYATVRKQIALTVLLTLVFLSYTYKSSLTYFISLQLHFFLQFYPTSSNYWCPQVELVVDK